MSPVSDIVVICVNWCLLNTVLFYCTNVGGLVSLFPDVMERVCRAIEQHKFRTVIFLFWKGSLKY